MEERKREALEKALNYLERQDRSCAQMTRYLARKGYEEEVVSAAVEQLQDWGYLNDRRYADAVVESSLERKNLSRRAVAQKLYQRGIDRDTAREALDEGGGEKSELKNALWWAQKLWPRIGAEQGKDSRAQREKLVRRLAARGFSYDMIRQAVESVTRADDWEE